MRGARVLQKRETKRKAGCSVLVGRPVCIPPGARPLQSVGPSRSPGIRKHAVKFMLA